MTRTFCRYQVQGSQSNTYIKVTVFKKMGACIPYCMILYISKNEHLLEPFPKQALVFTCLQYKSYENFLGKGEIAPLADDFCP